MLQEPPPHASLQLPCRMSDAVPGERSEADFTPIHASPKSPFVDIDALADLEVTPQESDKDKKKREAQEKCEELKEWGGKASLATLLSLTTCKEKLVLDDSHVGRLD
ncbi:unnamed protein product [Symbiodinium necroappetens]|uniref:Uncharacterized protein n=1 Tax=Symbiodinium necroappetens TaxID=1628268 RepID=A0A812W5N4_9DINO|nr:unnamed protein product [Symbiodinium necroappetens]